MADMARLQQALGYQFADQELLQLALSHRSVGARNNERLEFLGDSILNHIIAEALYRRFPAFREGELSRLRASLVRGDTLAQLAREIALGDYLLLGTGERKSGGQRRATILADAFEAIVGAILLDSDVEHCRALVLGWFASRLADLDVDAAGKDAKTRLQEYLQGRGYPLPVYELLDVQGEDHAQHFKVACRVHKTGTVTQGEGSSRRKAEQAAAQSALEVLADHGQ